MIVVQTLTAGDPGQEAPVVRGVLEVLAAAPVAEGIDEGRHHEDIEHRVREASDEAGPEPDEGTEQAQPDAEAEHTVREEHAIETIGPQVRGERLEGLRVPGLAHVIGDVEELDPPEAEQARAVRIPLAIGEGVVLAMDRYPFLAALPRRQPQGGPEGHVGYRVQMQ